MNSDYYQVLDVNPSADIDAISKAYRRKAMECHPDRGGSHAQMKLVNEAWTVLSDPAQRARYDEARANKGNEALQEAAAADARQAHKQAEQYPRKWADFERWVDQVVGDITGARHRSTEMLDVWRFPIVENSISGWVLIAMGIILGATIAGSTFHMPKKKDSDQPTWLIPAFIGGFCGAWIGAWLHRGIQNSIRTARESAARQEHRDQEPHSNQAHTVPNAATPESRIVACEKCGQKMRVPAVQAELLITCRSCKHKFSFFPC